MSVVQRVGPTVIRHGRRQGGRAAAAAEERERHIQLARQRCDRYGVPRVLAPVRSRGRILATDVRRKSVIVLPCRFRRSAVHRAHCLHDRAG